MSTSLADLFAQTSRISDLKVPLVIRAAFAIKIGQDVRLVAHWCLQWLFDTLNVAHPVAHPMT